MTRKFILSLFVVIGSIITLKAQTTTSDHSIGINLLGVEYSYEQSLGKAFTLNSSAGLGSNLIFSSGSKPYFDIAPYITIAPRYYYNINKRASRGQNVFKNSANYLTVKATYIFQPIAQTIDIDYRSRFGVAPAWGIKRVYNQKWVLDFNLGLNLLFDKGHKSDIAPAANIKFGYIF